MCANNEEKRKSLIQTLSTKVSDLNRTLILSGIGIVWIFVKIDDNGLVCLPINLLWTLILFVSSIALDLLQYVISIIVNAIFLRRKRIKKNMPDWYSYVPWVMWSLKVLIMIMAYILITIYLFDYVIE